MNKYKLLRAPLLAVAATLAIAAPGIAAAKDDPPSYVANPSIYKTIGQDERYVAMEVTWKAGQKDEWHSHPKGLVVHFLTDCHSRTTTRDGKSNETKRKAGETIVVKPVESHTFQNLGTSDCKHLHVEAK